MVPVATSISTIRDSVMGIATKSIIEALALGGFGNSCDISRYCSCGSGSDDQENRLCKVVVHVVVCIGRKIDRDMFLYLL